jgi:hypothetical protein
MKGFADVEIEVVAKAIGEEALKAFLSDFSTPHNADVEHFLKHNSLLFSKQGFSKTRLVLAQYQGKPVLAGYYTLCQKYIVIKERCKLSNTMAKRLRALSRPNKELKQKEIVAPLIAQLGKNATYKSANLITGDELLELATDTIRKSLRLLGGRVVYLECEDIPYLLVFYKRNGFFVFDERPLDCEERSMIKGDKLIQMIKFFHRNDIEAADLPTMTFEDLMSS